MFKKIYIFCLFILSTSCFALKVGTYEIPPYSMKEDGDIIGLVTDIVNEILQASGQQNPQLSSFPAARGLAEFDKGSLDLYYPIITEDKSKFSNVTLIGPIADYNISVFGRVGGETANESTDLSKYKIGAQNEGIASKLLEAKGVETSKTPTILASGQKLAAGRIDFWITGELTGIYYIALNELAEKIKLNYRYKSLPVYLGVGKNVDQSTLDKIKQAYEKFNSEDKFHQMQKEYEDRFSAFMNYLD